jgi:hypothetical protein
MSSTGGLVESPKATDRYHSAGTAVQQAGWKVLDLSVEKKTKRGPGSGEEERGEQALPPGLAKVQPQEVIDVKALKKKTRPPKRFTEGTLLTAMETAGKTLDEKELSEAMKETGLGTPATRAAIIEVLLKRDYIVRQGKSLEATDKGIRLIEVVHAEVKSPAMTGQWEAYLKRIQRGEAQLGPFLKGIEGYVREVVSKVGQTPQAAKRSLSISELVAQIRFIQVRITVALAAAVASPTTLPRGNRIGGRLVFPRALQVQPAFARPPTKAKTEPIRCACGKSAPGYSGGHRCHGIEDHTAAFSSSR